MVKVEVAASDIQAVDTAGGVEITIPARVHIFGALFLAFWLCGWAAGLVSASHKLIAGGPDSAMSTLFLMGWLGAWIVGGAWAMSILAWMLAGREIVRASVAELQHVRTLGPFSISREYEMAQVKRLRVFQGAFAGSSQGKFYFGGPFGSGTVAFDYGASTKRFGMGIDEAAAQMVVEKLTKRFRNLAAS